ncbi:cilia- and flagella-associated protein 100-like [Engraulis encrasicolus]|uniref:cilia- and flagella-associated protein 100-like n=1 Tax=Engraulis encrasicolus TaxID=184585 RepID=UPI002FD6EE0E
MPAVSNPTDNVPNEDKKKRSVTLSTKPGIKSNSSKKSDGNDGTTGNDGNSDVSQKNPFALPREDVFQLRRKQKKTRMEERDQQKDMRVHQRFTHLGRLQEKRGEFRKQLKDWEGGTNTNPASKTSLKNDPSWRKAAGQEQTDKDTIHEYINKKRDMFFIEYSLAVKQEVITNLSEIARAEETRLERSLQYLDEDAAMFDEFLKENDKSSVEAIKIAEQETKAKLEKIAEIKKITGKIVAVKSDISKFEDILKEYTNYNDFLLKLSPPEWQEKQKRRREMAQKIRQDVARRRLQEANATAAKLVQPQPPQPPHPPQTRHRNSVTRELPPVMDPRSHRRSQVTPIPKEMKTKGPPSPPAEDFSNYDLSEFEDPQLFFSDPQQLLDLLTELEKQNLNLIQNSQDTEETLEEFRITMINTRKKMEKETEQLAQHVEIISHQIERESERAAELELKARLFSFGEYKADHQDRMLDTLGKKVEEVYRLCVGETEANLTTLQMLTSIEGRLDELLEYLEMVPRERLVTVERVREKERRIRQREEKANLQKKQQEERLRKALERAQADIKKANGRKLMPRSQPPTHESQDNIEDEVNDVENERHQYFFT